MSATITDLEHGNSTTDATSFNTGSISPTNGKVVLVTTVGVAVDNVMPTISGLSMTWTEVASEGGVGEVPPNRSMRMWRGVANGNSGALTIDWGAKTQLRCFWSIVELSGVDAGGTNGSNAIVQSVTSSRDNGGGAITSYSATLAAFAESTNATYGVIHTSSHSTVTPGSGFTEVGTSNVESQNLSSERKYSEDTTVDWTFSSADTEVAIIAVELSVGETITEAIKDPIGMGVVPFAR